MNYKKRKAKRNSTRCTMCKWNKKIGNGKDHFKHSERVKRAEIVWY